MKIYLALSCFQTRPMRRAWEDLLKLEPYGIQLTPGCLPSLDFWDDVHTSKVPVRHHHGFSYTEYRTKVWPISTPTLLAAKRGSIHPPYRKEVDFKTWLRIAQAYPELTYETMWGPYLLSTDDELFAAMSARLKLAVDTSHLKIQLQSGAVSEFAVRHLMEYDRIEEIHVSDNNGKSDSHRPITRETYGLRWAQERGDAGVPVILEGYFHKLSFEQQQEQMEILNG